MLFAFSIRKKKSDFIHHRHLEKTKYITEVTFRRLYRNKYFQHIQKNLRLELYKLWAVIKEWQKF